MAAIEWLGSYYVEMQVAEKAVTHFERAVLMQPTEPRWPLLVASCLRRSGNHQSALRHYQAAQRKFPQNIECKCYRQSSKINPIQIFITYSFLSDTIIAYYKLLINLCWYFLLSSKIQRSVFCLNELFMNLWYSKFNMTCCINCKMLVGRSTVSGPNLQWLGDERRGHWICSPPQESREIQGGSWEDRQQQTR